MHVIGYPVLSIGEKFAVLISIVITVESNTSNLKWSLRLVLMYSIPQQRWWYCNQYKKERDSRSYSIKSLVTIDINSELKQKFSSMLKIFVTRGYKPFKLYFISITLSSCCCSSASLSRSCLDRNIIIVVVESNTSNPISNFISWSNISFRKPLYWGQTEVGLN